MRPGEKFVWTFVTQIVEIACSNLEIQANLNVFGKPLVQKCNIFRSAELLNLNSEWAALDI